MLDLCSTGLSRRIRSRALTALSFLSALGPAACTDIGESEEIETPEGSASAWVSTENDGADVAPTLVSFETFNNPTCADLLGGDYFEYKVDDPTDGDYGDSAGGANISIHMNGGSSLDWSSDTPISAVLLKSGVHGHNLYDYVQDGGPGKQLADDGLTTPAPYFQGISHVSFCYKPELQVTKTAATTFTRSYSWSVEKTGAQSELTLSPGQTYVLGYSVTAAATQEPDSDPAVSGSITVHNPTNMTVLVTGVSDSLSNGTSLPVSCAGSFPVSLAPGAELACTYEAALSDFSELTNTATATSGTPRVDGGSGTAAVGFGDPSTVLDECAIVTDDAGTPADAADDVTLGIACAGSPMTFSYTNDIGPYGGEACGEQSVTNTAAFRSNDDGSSGSDSWTVGIDVACQLGCTLTQGYWKTHSQEGPAPYDDAWLLVGAAQEDSLLLSSGLTWHTVFWTPPQGRAWYILAHQFMAATLNVLNGADATSISTVLAQAQTLLSTNPPSTGKGKVATRMTQLGGQLAAFNEGSVGPGHCSE